MYFKQKNIMLFEPLNHNNMLNQNKMLPKAAGSKELLLNKILIEEKAFRDAMKADEIFERVKIIRTRINALVEQLKKM